ncbi:uncharacterized protein [Penaeus vannamei]|uniref:uncharacterized protein n=1 Tax=Penaeus vannamei TaxID=6689 RepID=UPI00387F7338
MSVSSQATHRLQIFAKRTCPLESYSLGVIPSSSHVPRRLDVSAVTSQDPGEREKRNKIKSKETGRSIKLELVTPAFRLWPSERKESCGRSISSSTAGLFRVSGADDVTAPPDIADFGLKSCTERKSNTLRSSPSRGRQNNQRLSSIDFRRGRLGGDLRAAPKRRHYANITTCQHRALADTR